MEPNTTNLGLFPGKSADLWTFLDLRLTINVYIAPVPASCYFCFILRTKTNPRRSKGRKRVCLIAQRRAVVVIVVIRRTWIWLLDGEEIVDNTLRWRLRN